MTTFGRVLGPGRRHYNLQSSIVCEGGDIGRTAMWSGALPHCYYQNHLHRARVRDTSTADPQFVLYWLWYAFEIGNVYFGRGNVTTIPNLSQSKLCELPLPVPPVHEQRRIAAVLGVVQQAIQQQERLLLRPANYSDIDRELKPRQNAVIRGFDLSLYYAGLNSNDR